MSGRQESALALAWMFAIQAHPHHARCSLLSKRRFTGCLLRPERLPVPDDDEPPIVVTLSAETDTLASPCFVSKSPFHERTRRHSVFSPYHLKNFLKKPPFFFSFLSDSLLSACAGAAGTSLGSSSKKS